MENETVSVYDLISKGGVYSGIQGDDLEHIYGDICSKAVFPDGVDRNLVKQELLEREKVLSTAVGEGFAIPHTRKSVITKDEDQCILLCYLEKSLDMHAPDSRNVDTMFVLLTSSNKSHLQSLSALAGLIRNPEVKKALEDKLPKEEILQIIKKNS